ncbi:1316_t:CDS:2, partial [Gigaspora rosea]
MITSIFQEWLHDFDSLIKNYKGQKVLLFLDNCSSHKTTATIIKNCWHHTNLIPYWDNPANSEESEDEVSLEDLLLEELSKNIEDLNFSNPIRVEEYLNNPDEDIVYKIPDDNQIISDLVETFGERSGKIENNPEEVDDSVEEEII